MAVDIEQVKKLRAQTGVGITDAKKALEAAKGDYDKALEEMRIKGLAKAEKRGEREASAGAIGSYLHGDRVGVLVELNCETDFVARNEIFTDLLHEVCLHVAASAPRYISADDVDADVLAKEKELIVAELKESGKPEEMIDKISEGKLAKFYDEICLLNQPFIKNPDQKVGEMIKEVAAKLGENIVVGRFSRIALGEE